MPFEQIEPAADVIPNTEAAPDVAPDTKPDAAAAPKNPSLLDAGGADAAELKEVADADKSILDKAAEESKQAEIAGLKDKIAKSTDETEKKSLQEKLDKLAAKPADAKLDAKKEVVPEKYEFKIPEGMQLDQAMVDKFVPIAKELGLTQEKAQSLVDLYAGAMKAATDAQQASYEKFVNDSKAETIKALGAEWKQEIAFAAKSRDRLLSPETITELNNSGLANRVSLIKDLIKIGKLISEDTIIPGGGGASENEGKSYAELMYPNQGK